MRSDAREEAYQKWGDGRTAWLVRRWGNRFAEFVISHYVDWGHLEAAEIWAGICWELFDDGAQDLDEVAALEELKKERTESMARSALGHGR